MAQRHIVIVGGGIIGTSILYYLSKAQLESQSGPLHLTLLEESEELAPAASGKSGGFLAKDWHGSDTADLGRLSYELHEQLAKEDGGEGKWHFREVETLSVKYDSSKKAKLSSKSSVPSWLDVKHVTQSSNMGGNHTTAQVTPKNLVEHLVSESKEFATKLGDDKLKVDIRLGCRADEVIMENDKVKQIKISKANDSSAQILDLDDVVVAAGPWTGSLLASLLPTALVNSPPKSLSFLKPSSRISGSRAHSIVLKSSSPTTAHCLFTDMHYSDDQGESRAGAPEIYARSDGTVYICGGSDSVKLPKNADEVGHDVKQIEKLKEQSKAISPETLGQDAEVVKEQACYLPISSSTGSPILAGDKNSGIYVSAGHSCWGITLSLGTGLCMSELILNGKVKSADVDDLMG